MPQTLGFTVELGLPLFFGFVALVIVGGMFGARHQARQARANLAQLGERLGLGVLEGKRLPIIGSMPAGLGGSCRGRAMRVFTYSTGTSKNRTQWCALAAKIADPRGFTLSISAENFLTRAGRMIGVDDVAIGDEVFDRRFYVKSNDPDYVRAALLPEVRAKLLEAWKPDMGGSIAVQGDEVRYTTQGSFAQTGTCNRLAGVTEIVCDLAEIVDVRSR